MMSTFMRKLLGPVAGLVLGLAAAPAFAGEWVDGIYDDEFWKVLVYKGKFYEGEFANLYYGSDGKKDFMGDSRQQRYKLVMVLNNGDARITGFTGVHLAGSTGETLLTLSYEPSRFDYATMTNVPDAEGDSGSYEAATHGGWPAHTVHKNDWHACYRSLADLNEGTGAVRCDSGEGRWIYVEAVGTLKEEMRRVNDSAGLTMEEMLEKAVKDTAEGHAGGRREFYSPGPAIRAANRLVVGAKHGEYTSFNLTIDDTFRHALWDEAFWKNE